MAQPGAWYIFGKSYLNASGNSELQNSSEELLFLHGRYGNSSLWKIFTEKEGFHSRSHSLDLPGFGRSFTIDGRSLSLNEHVELATEYVVRQWGRRQGKRKPDDDQILLFVGHDMGGTIAQLCALEVERRCPGLVSGLVLMNPCSLTGINCPIWRWTLGHRLRQLLNTSKMLKPEFRKMIKTPDLKNLLRIAQTWPDREDQERIRESLKGFNKPVLLLWGALDELNPPTIARELTRLYPDVEFFQNDHAGHWPWIEYPEWVATKLKEFFFKVRQYPAKRFDEPSPESA